MAHAHMARTARCHLHVYLAAGKPQHSATMSHWLYVYFTRHPVLNWLLLAVVIGLAIDFCTKFKSYK